MLKRFFEVFITTSILGIFLSSCVGKKENFDIDLSTFKIPQKTIIKNSEQESSDSSQIKTLNFKNKLLPYKEKSEVLNSVKIGKQDPFSQESDENKFSLDFKLKGFLDSGIEKYVFVNYQNKTGTITEESIGGLNTKLLPNGARVVGIDIQNMKLIINFENKEYIFKL